MKFTHKLHFPNIASFVFALVIYFMILGFIIFLLIELEKKQALTYTINKNSFMDINLNDFDLFNDDSLGKNETGLIAKKDNALRENPKNEVKKIEQAQKKQKTEEIKSEIQENAKEEKPAEKPEKANIEVKPTEEKKEKKDLDAKEKIDTKKLFDTVNFNQSEEAKKVEDLLKEKKKEEAKISQLFASSTENLKNSQSKVSVTQNNEEISQGSSKSQVKKGSSTNAQKQGIYDPYFGEIQRRVEIMWNRYSLNKLNKMPSIILTLNKKGEVLKIEKKAIANVHYMDKVNDLVDAIYSLRKPQFPEAPNDRDFSNRITIEIKLGIMN